MTAALFLGLPTRGWAQETVTYYHTDGIGSVRMITAASGNVVARYDYLPFGERCEAACPPTDPVDKRQFAGKERDTQTGFDYFGARYYASQAGRFSTVDPAMEIGRNLLDPQNWNRYTYGLDNPLKFTDKDGRSATLVGGLVGGAIGGAIAMVQGRAWREIGAAAAGGAVSGAMLGSVIDTGGTSLPILLGGGALAGIEGRLVENAINGQATTWEDAVLSGLSGTTGIAAGQTLGTMARQSVKMIDAGSVRFSQSSIAASFRGGGSVDELAAGLRNGTINPKSIPAIRLVERDGKFYSLDNRRLYAAQRAGAKIPYRMATPDEILRERYKFTTMNDGTSVEVR
jgi:RHS repeat-associated protein